MEVKDVFMTPGYVEYYIRQLHFLHLSLFCRTTQQDNTTTTHPPSYETLQSYRRPLLQDKTLHRRQEIHVFDKTASAIPLRNK